MNFIASVAGLDYNGCDCVLWTLQISAATWEDALAKLQAWLKTKQIPGSPDRMHCLLREENDMMIIHL